MLERHVTSTQALAASGAALLVAVLPLLALKLGRPTGGLGDFLFVFCPTLSIFAPASLAVVTFADIVKRTTDKRLIAAFVLSLTGVAAVAAFIYLRIQQHYAIT